MSYFAANLHLMVKTPAFPVWDSAPAHPEEDVTQVDSPERATPGRLQDRVDSRKYQYIV